MSKTRMVFYGALGALVSVMIWSFIGGCHTSPRPQPPAAPVEEEIVEEIVPPSEIGRETLVEEGIVTPDQPPAPAASTEETTPAEETETKEADPTRVHTVAKGDTLWGISRQYGVSLDEIAEANQLADPGRLSIGQQLVIP